MTPASVRQIADDLAGLGVARGDTLMVHASLRKVGPVEGGPRGLLSALEARVGPEGTLMMPLGADTDWWWVNDRPPAERPAILKAMIAADVPAFDANETPADEEIGYLAEVFRRAPGTLVTDHPDGRMAARGARAGLLLADPPWNDYLGPGSPLDRFVQAGGKVLRLGADLNTVTVLHLSEYLAALPNKRRVRRHHIVRGPSGPAIVSTECLDDSDGIVDWEDTDYFELLMRDYIAQGHGAQGTIGYAESELIDAAHLVAFGADWMAKNLAEASVAMGDGRP